MRRWVPLLVLSSACGAPPLLRANIDGASAGRGAGLVQVAASAAAPPVWLEQDGVTVSDAVRFVGRGFAPSAALAEQAATRDLLANVSMFVAVDVEATSKTRVSGGGEGDLYEEQLHLSSALPGLDLRPDARYWTRHVSPVLGSVGGGQRVAYSVRASVPLAVIRRARAAARARRLQAGEGARVVVLPFVHTSSAAAQVVPWLQVELTHRLGRAAVDADEVRAALAGVGPVDALRIERAEQTFGPSLVVSGLVEQLDGALLVTVVRHDLEAQASSTLGVLQGTATAPAALAAAVAACLTDAAPAQGEARPVQAALRAERAFADGDLEAALTHIRASLRVAPTAASFVRLGRILDRLGRYARPAKLPGARSSAPAPALEVCTEAGRSAARAAERRIVDLEAALTRPAGPRWFTEDTPELDAVLRPVLAAVEGWTRCPAPQVRCVDTCVREGAACPDIEIDARLGPRWRHLYGGKVWVPDGQPILQGPAPGHAILSVSRGESMQIQQVEGLGHWLMVAGPRSRGWVRRTQVELRDVPGPRAPAAQIRSAVEAYAAAFARRGEDGDRRGQASAALALANAAMRAEGLGPARRLFSAVRALGVRTGDEDLVSRAGFGLGRTLRRLQRREQAWQALQEALRIRQRLGGRTLELELHAELGGLALERGQPRRAAQALGRAWRLARRLGNPQLEVVSASNLGVLALARGARAPAHASFTQALDHLRDISEAQGTIVAALNLAFTEGLAGDAGAAAGLRDEAWRRAVDGGGWRWLAEVSTQRGLAKAGASLEALHVAARIFGRLGRGSALLRVQDALLVEELRSDPGSAACVAQAYWRLGAPVHPAPDGWPAEATLEAVPSQDLGPADLGLAANAAAALVLHDWAPQLGRAPPAARRGHVLMLPDPLRPAPPPSGDALQVEEVLVVETRPGVLISGQGTSGRARPAPIPYRARVGYDRVLDSLVVAPRAHLALTPARLEESLGGWRGPRARRVRAARALLGAAVRHAQALGLRRTEAHVRLNLAALTWFSWEPEAAYRMVSRARESFAGLEDARGLALTDEWLGYMMRQSERPAAAAEHLGRARAVFAGLDDAAAVERVLAYGE